MSRAKLSLDRIRWSFFSEEARDWLADLKGNAATGEVVKDYPKRRVLRLPGLFAKEVRYWGLPSLQKSLVGGTACKEGNIYLELSRRGISVPEVLAFGRERRGPLLVRDLLLTREIEHGHPLDVYLSTFYSGLSFSEKRLIIEKFAAFVRNLHDKGVFHSDFHVGNILVVENQAEIRFFLLDADRIKVGEVELSLNRRLKNLALLLTSVQNRSSRAERLRFLKAYGVRFDEDGRKFMENMEEISLAGSRKIWRKKALRCLENNRRFFRKSSGTFKVYGQRTPEAEECLAALLPDPDRLLETGVILKAGRTVRAARISLNGRYFFLKRYNCKGWFYRIRNAVRRSRAVRTWLTSWEYRVRGIDVPEPLLCLEDRHFRLLGRTYLLSEFITGAEQLREVWPGLDASQTKGMLARLAVLFGRMHRMGCLHGDLKWANILVGSLPDKKVYLIDLDGSRIYRRWEARRFRRDIDRFLREVNGGEAADEQKAFLLQCWQRWSLPVGHGRRPRM